MKRQNNLVWTILIAFIFSLVLTSYQQLNKKEMHISDTWKAPINQGYEYYLKGMLKHLQLDIDISADETVTNYNSTPTRNVPIMILPIK